MTELTGLKDHENPASGLPFSEGTKLIKWPNGCLVDICQGQFCKWHQAVKWVLDPIPSATHLPSQRIELETLQERLTVRSPSDAKVKRKKFQHLLIGVSTDTDQAKALPCKTEKAQK